MYVTGWRVHIGSEWIVFGYPDTNHSKIRGPRNRYLNHPRAKVSKISVIRIVQLSEDVRSHPVYTTRCAYLTQACFLLVLVCPLEQNSVQSSKTAFKRCTLYSGLEIVSNIQSEDPEVETPGFRGTYEELTFVKLLLISVMSGSGYDSNDTPPCVTDLKICYKT